MAEGGAQADSEREEEDDAYREYAEHVRQRDDRKAGGTKFDKTLVEAVRRLHSRLGHPESGAFVTTLRLGGASQDALAFARQMHCAVCVPGSAGHR